MTKLKIGVSGCSGKMGIAILNLINKSKECSIGGGLESSESHTLGQNLGNLINDNTIDLKITADRELFFSHSDIIIDFSSPESTSQNIDFAKNNKKSIVIGTTGLSKKTEEKISKASESIPIIYSANMSIGVNILFGLTRKLSSMLNEDDFDIEILEMHHKDKVDSPSGTAIAIGKSAAQGRNIDLSSHSEISREGIDCKRKKGNIGFASLRGGSVTGDHTVIFSSMHERLEIRHIAEDRSLFASGALKAAIWLYDQNPGLYSMKDVLNINL